MIKLKTTEEYRIEYEDDHGPNRYVLTLNREDAMELLSELSQALGYGIKLPDRL